MKCCELTPGTRLRVTKPYLWPKKIVVRVVEPPELYVRTRDRWGDVWLHAVSEVEPAPPVKKH